MRWEPASFGAVHDLLTNPVYAGAFVYGRTRQRKTVDPDGQIRTRTELLPISEWRVCLPDHHPGYISLGRTTSPPRTACEPTPAAAARAAAPPAKAARCSKASSAAGAADGA